MAMGWRLKSLNPSCIQVHPDVMGRMAACMAIGVLDGKRARWRVQAFAQYAFKMARVVRLQRLCGSGQVEVEKPRYPEAQGGRLQHDGPGSFFFVREGANAGVGVQPGVQLLVVEDAGVAFYAPVVDADRDVEQPGVPAGEVEVDEASHARHLESAVEQDVVPEQVAMGRAEGQGLVGRRGGVAGLLVQRLPDQHVLRMGQEGQHLGYGFLPPWQAAQIRLMYAEVGPRQMCARQCFACQRAMSRAWIGLIAARKAADDGARFAMQC